MWAAPNPGVVYAIQNLVEGLRGPVEWMRDLVPFSDEREDLGLEIDQVGEVRCAEPLALENREPLLHLFIYEQWTGVKCIRN